MVGCSADGHHLSLLESYRRRWWNRCYWGGGGGCGVAAAAAASDVVMQLYFLGKQPPNSVQGLSPLFSPSPAPARLSASLPSACLLSPPRPPPPPRPRSLVAHVVRVRLLLLVCVCTGRVACHAASSCLPACLPVVYSECTSSTTFTLLLLPMGDDEGEREGGGRVIE